MDLGPGPADLAVFAAFWLLLTATLMDGPRRSRLAAKPGEDWALDLIGLLVQGLVVPLLQALLVLRLLAAALPEQAGVLSASAPLAFLLSFAGVDYLYYWNHRLLHHDRLWPLHRVHHSMTDLDVMGTSRNTLWTSAFIVYLWVHPVFVHLLADPTFYLAGVAATSGLDLWRHSALGPRSGGLLERSLGWLLILPGDHAWHHAAEPGAEPGNYGANLKLWDRLHGTLRQEATPPPRLGIPVPLSLTRRLLWPFDPAAAEGATPP